MENTMSMNKLNSKNKNILHSKLERYALLHSYYLKTGSPSNALSMEEVVSSEGSKNFIKADGYTDIQPLCADILHPLGIYVYVAYDTSPVDPKPATIFCRGTQSDASIIADLDYYGPGYTAVVSNRVAILKELEEILSKTRTSELELAGHSLGGAVAQLILWLVSVEKRHAPAKAIINQIDSIALSTFHSAPVSKEVASYTSENVRSIVKNSGAEFNLSIRHHQTALDPVNLSSLLIGHDMSENHADVDLVRSSLSVLEYMESFFNLSGTQHNSFFYSPKGSFTPISNELLSDHVNSQNRIYSNSNRKGRDTIQYFTAPQRVLDLPKIFGSIHGWIKWISTPILKLVYTIFNLVYKLIIASSFLLAAFVVPTITNIAFCANAFRDFFGSLFQFLTGSLSALNKHAKSAATTVFLAEKAKDVNAAGVRRNFDQDDLDQTIILEATS